VIRSNPVSLPRRLLIQLIFLIAASALVSQALAQQTTAESAAKTFVAHLDTINPADIYDSELGPTFKQAIKKDYFVSNTGVIKIQTGGPALARQMVGGQALTQTPNGQSGTFYYVRFKTKFPSGFVFQDVYLEMVDNKWKISGYWIAPAPQY
jgi:hypothetical protein